MSLGSFKQTSNKIIVADPADTSLDGAQRNYPTMIAAKNVLKGTWHIYQYDDDKESLAYILHEDYINDYKKFRSIDKWLRYKNTITVWCRMFGFFDSKFFRNDDVATGKKCSDFVKVSNSGDKWYNYCDYNYWKGSCTESVMKHGCTTVITKEDFCPVDDFGCFYLKNDNRKIHGLAVGWGDNEEDEDE